MSDVGLPITVNLPDLCSGPWSRSGHQLFHPRWPILYEDNHLLCLYKPAGLLVQGDRSGDLSLLEIGKLWLKQHYRKPGRVFLGLVHRLDRPAAGVVLFARTSKAAARLSEQFRTAQVEKLYLAVVEGHPRAGEGILEHQIERREGSSRIASAGALGKTQTARLRYRVIERSSDRSLVAVRLETGRKHQIRLQLAAHGTPLVGDLRYGASQPLSARQIALLAWRLCVHHPTRRQPLELTSPIPRGWPWDASRCPASSTPWNWRDLEKRIHALVQRGESP